MKERICTLSVVNAEIVRVPLLLILCEWSTWCTLADDHESDGRYFSCLTGWFNLDSLLPANCRLLSAALVCSFVTSYVERGLYTGLPFIS